MLQIEPADPTPHTHPAAPSSLPDSFVQYRSKAQQHGPLAGHRPPQLQSRSQSQLAAAGTGGIGSTPGHALGSVKPGEGEVFDRNDLPSRFWRMAWTQAEIDAVESGGASAWG